jgi:hypothetical protein
MDAGVGTFRLLFDIMAWLRGRRNGRLIFPDVNFMYGTCYVNNLGAKVSQKK